MERNSVIDKLDIFIITFNRAKRLEKTLQELFSDTSAVRDFSITIFDNNSSDETCSIVRKYQEKYPNLNYQKNDYNINGNGNITKAFYSAKKEYVWVLADNDNYCFDCWNQVEQAIEKKADAIVVSTFECPKLNLAQLFVQMTFVPGVIYKTSNIDDTVLANMTFNISNMFPHLVLASKMVNYKKEVVILDKPVVLIGNNNDENGKYVYTRGFSDDIHPLQAAISWFGGYANSLWMIKDRKIRNYLANNNKFSIPLTSPRLFFHKPKETKENLNFYNIFCVFFVLSFFDRIKFLLNLLLYYSLYRIIFIYKEQNYSEKDGLITTQFNLRLFYFIKTKLFKTKRMCQ